MEKIVLARRSRDPADFIRTRLRLAPVPLLPELRLYTAHQGSGLGRLGASRADGTQPPAPYWAFPWAGGMVLARYLLDRPQTVRGRRVLDLGAGSGLVAIAAALAGADAVSAADIDPYALAAIGLNAAENGVAVAVIDVDLAAGPPPAVDLVLAGDVFYAPEIAARMLVFLDACLAVGLDVLVGDPGRAYLPRHRLRQLAEYPVPDMGQRTASPTHPGAVFSLTGREAGEGG